MRRITLCFVCLFLAVGCHKKAKKEKVSPPKVRVGKVTEETVPVLLRAVGHFTPFNSANLSAQVGGELMQIHFQEGQMVKAGDLLFSIDQRPYAAKLDAASATKLRNEASLAYAQEKVSRYESLVSENYTSILDYIQYKTNRDMLEAMLLQNDADIRYAEIQLDFCSIHAPFSGVIGKRQVDIGNVIAADGSTLVTLNQVNPIYIDFSIPEREFMRIQTEQRKHPLEVQISYMQEDKICALGELVMIDNQITATNGMIPLRAIMHNPERTFWPGQFVRVSLLVTHIPQAVMVPTSAINQGQKGQFVFVVDSSQTARMQYISIGEVYEGKTQVTKGLKPGQRIVTEGQVNISNNKKVQVAS